MDSWSSRFVLGYVELRAKSMNSVNCVYTGCMYMYVKYKWSRLSDKLVIIATYVIKRSTYVHHDG